MGFWTGAGSSVAMPKRQSRWLLTVGDIPTWVCKSVSKPSYTVGESAHRYINHTFYFPGRLEWNTVNATLVDPLDPDISRAMLDLTRRAGYNYPTDAEAAQSILSKAGMVSSLGNISLKQLGPNVAIAGTATAPIGVRESVPSAQTIEEWVLHNAWIQSVNFGSLSYDSDELVDIAVVFRYDYAQFVPGMQSKNLLG